MAIEDFYTTPVTIVNPQIIGDRYNEAAAEVILDYDNPADTTAALVWLEQLAAEEVLDGRDAQVTHWRLFGSSSLPISAISRVVADPPEYEMPSTTFEVEGTPNVLSTPSGPHHVEALLKLVTG